MSTIATVTSDDPVHVRLITGHVHAFWTERLNILRIQAAAVAVSILSIAPAMAIVRPPLSPFYRRGYSSNMSQYLTAGEQLICLSAVAIFGILTFGVTLLKKRFPHLRPLSARGSLFYGAALQIIAISLAQSSAVAPDTRLSYITLGIYEAGVVIFTLALLPTVAKVIADHRFARWTFARPQACCSVWLMLALRNIEKAEHWYREPNRAAALRLLTSVETTIAGSLTTNRRRALRSVTPTLAEQSLLITSRLREVKTWIAVPIESTHRDVVRELRHLADLAARGMWGHFIRPEAALLPPAAVESKTAVVCRAALVAGTPIAGAIALYHFVPASRQLTIVSVLNALTICWAVITVLRAADPEASKKLEPIGRFSDLLSAVLKK